MAASSGGSLSSRRRRRVNPKVTYSLVGLLVVHVIPMAVLSGFGNTAATVTGWLIMVATELISSAARPRVESREPTAIPPGDTAVSRMNTADTCTNRPRTSCQPRAPHPGPRTPLTACPS